MPGETVGTAIADANGNLVWVGREEGGITVTVYDDVGRARRRLTDIYRATDAAGAGRHPLRLARVRIIVEQVGEPITPRLRRDDAG